MKAFRLKRIVVMLSVALISFFLFTHCATRPSTKPAAGLSSKLVEIETRPGIALKLILIKPEKPVASVILFAGGKGKLKLSSAFGRPFINGGKNIFVVRTRKDFAKHGLMVALVDMPSDYYKNVGKHYWWIDWPNRRELFRMSDEHAQDIKAIAAYLKNESNVPVWLVGTSRGTISATNGAIRIKDNIDGLVLTSSITRTKVEWRRIHATYPNYILDMRLNSITVPTLLVAHEDDKCISTPAEGAQKIKNRLINSKDVEVMYFSGGKAAIDNECWGRSAHGFYGIEEEVVSAIANFIKNKSN